MSTKLHHTSGDKSMPDNTVLVEYLNNALDETARRELEEMFTDDQQLGDAIEGLKQLKDGKEAAAINANLNRMIQAKIKNRRKKRLKSLSFPLWLILLMAVVLLLMLAGYVIISKLP